MFTFHVRSIIIFCVHYIGVCRHCYPWADGDRSCASPMSSGCPPQSPAVAKSEVAVEGECPLLAATFAYWDNILGPRVRHIWAPKGDHFMFLSDGEVTFLANHTLNGEILRSAECGAVDVKFFVLAEKGVIIVSLIFDGELKGDKNTCALSIILPQSELAFYLPLHTICVERLKHVIRKGRIWMQKVAFHPHFWLFSIHKRWQITALYNRKALIKPEPGSVS